MNNWVIFLVIFLTGILLSGDYLIKYSVGKENPMPYLISAGILWCISIYGWYITFQHNRIAIVGILFAMFSLIGTTCIGVFGFGERLSMSEWVGLGMALVASVLLSGKI